MGWFTVNSVDKDTFIISEYQHWEQPHIYLLCGSQKALLIDTGLGISNIQTVARQLTSLPIDVVTTHIHWDHIGAHKYFDSIGVHKLEVSWMDGHFPLPLSVVKKNLIKGDNAFPEGFHLSDYSIYQGKPQFIYEDGYIFELGNRRIKVIHTPGHSPGHCCFYDIDRGYLFTGDLIYKGKLDAYYPSTNPYEFYQSILKLQEYNIERIFPEHFDLDISVEIIREIADAFEEIKQNKKLYQGAGIFSFDKFQIHI